MKTWPPLLTNALSGETKEDTKTAAYAADGVALDGADAEGKVVLIHSMRNLGRSWLEWGEFQQECSSRMTAFANTKRKKALGIEKFQNVNQRKNAGLSQVLQRECMMPQTSF